MKDSNDNTVAQRLRIAFVGLGERGMKALAQLAEMPEVEVTALCDLSAEHIQAAEVTLLALCTERPSDTCQTVEATCPVRSSDFTEVCRRADVDLVYICTDWRSHAELSLEALRAGKHVAVEVPAALTLGECQQLVQAARESGRHCFLLENCCFEDQFLDALTAIRRGDIGEVVHAEGSYYHCLGDRWTPWRLEVNRHWRGDLYPTHELGPICQALDVGGRDRLQTVVCIDSAAHTGAQEYERVTGSPCPDFQNGDHTTTLIRTRLGRTILLRHDVLTPQPYERRLVFIGTRGRIELNDTGRASHAAMTLAMHRHLVNCLVTGSQPSITVNDMATWCAVGPLSRQSIESGFAPVEVPVFE